MNGGPERDLIEQGLRTSTSRRGLLRGARYAAGAGLVVAGAGALGQLDKLFGQGRAEAQEVDLDLENPQAPEKLFIPGNRIINGDFDIRDPRDPSRPLFWQKVGYPNLSHYNLGDAYSGRRSVSEDIIEVALPDGSCRVISGGWQYSLPIPIRQFTFQNSTAELAYFVKHKTFKPSGVDAIDVVRFKFLDFRRQPMGDPSFYYTGIGPEDTYILHRVTFGPGGIPWPEGAAFLKFNFEPTLQEPSPTCSGREKVAEVFRDNTYFGPVRRR